MSEAVFLKLIEQLPAIITAAAVIFGAYWSYKAKNSGAENAKAIETVRLDVNDKMQQLVETTGKAEHAKGMKQESEEQALRDQQPMKVEIVESPVAVTVVKDGKA